MELSWPSHSSASPSAQPHFGEFRVYLLPFLELTESFPRQEFDPSPALGILNLLQTTSPPHRPSHCREGNARGAQDPFWDLCAVGSVCHREGAVRNGLDQPRAGEEEQRKGEGLALSFPAHTRTSDGQQSGRQERLYTHLQSRVHSNCSCRFMVQINCASKLEVSPR